MKVRFKFMIFQESKLSEELESEQEFADVTQLAQALISFAAQESTVRCEREVIQLYSGIGPKINLPCAQEGYGPATNVVIRKITIL